MPHRSQNRENKSQSTEHRARANTQVLHRKLEMGPKGKGRMLLQRISDRACTNCSTPKISMLDRNRLTTINYSDPNNLKYSFDFCLLPHLFRAKYPNLQISYTWSQLKTRIPWVDILRTGPRAENRRGGTYRTS